MIKDFSTMIPDPVTLRLGRSDQIKDVDLSIVPARSSLKIIRFFQEKGEDEDISAEECISLAADTLHDIDPSITAEWLWSNYSLKRLTEIATYVLERAAGQEGRSPTEGGEATKNV